MENVYLLRNEFFPSCIRSVLYAKGRKFFILERPWLNNQQDISCIPAKTYLCKFIKRSASGKYKNVYWIMDVENRVGVLTHNGNLVFQTNGCLLIGMKKGILAGQPAVLSSMVALSQFVHLMEKKDFYLHVIGNQIVEAA